MMSCPLSPFLTYQRDSLGLSLFIRFRVCGSVHVAEVCLNAEERQYRYRVLCRAGCGSDLVPTGPLERSEPDSAQLTTLSPTDGSLQT